MINKVKLILFLFVMIFFMTMVYCICANEYKIQKQEKQEIQIESTFNEATTKTDVNSDKEVKVEDKKEEVNIEKIAEETTEKKEEIVKAPEQINLGNFRLTAYCSCTVCCGVWVDTPTASGTMPLANRTIAVDTNIIPFGTKVIINGNEYIAEDTGSAIKGNRIDIYMPTHEEALNFGVQYADVFVERY